MKRFRIYKTGKRVYVQQYQSSLFGMMWCEVVSFPIACEPECKAIVDLLNKCDKKSQDNDPGRDIAVGAHV